MKKLFIIGLFLITTTFAVGCVGTETNNGGDSKPVGSVIPGDSNETEAPVFHQNYGEIGKVPKNWMVAHLTRDVPDECDIVPYYDGAEKCIKTTWNGDDKGSIFIGGFTPAVRSRIDMELAVSATHRNHEVYIMGIGYWIVISDCGENFHVRNYYYTNDRRESHAFTVPKPKDSRILLSIELDGAALEQTVTVNGEHTATIPMYVSPKYLDLYSVFSSNMLRVSSYVSSVDPEGHIECSIYEISQTIPSPGPVVPIGDSRIIPVGIDGPRLPGKQEDGIAYIIEHGGRLTLWPTLGYLSTNPELLAYSKNLVENEEFELGVHFTQRLTDLSFDDACTLIDNEIAETISMFGQPPRSWCSFQNADNIDHAIYIYDTYGIVWRNGVLGTSYLSNIGNIEDYNWNWWYRAADAGVITPTFTHSLDEDPAPRYSISPKNWKHFVKTYSNNGISIVPFYDWHMIRKNTEDAMFTIHSDTDNELQFTAHTNGYRTRVYVPRSCYCVAFDAAGEIETESAPDGNLIFNVENNVTYTVIPKYG